MANFPSYVNQNFYMGEGGSNNTNIKRIQGIPETGEDGIIFCNEFYNTPLYREPNNGTVYRIRTDPYRPKNCLYAFNGDTNGFFYWLGTKFGTFTWANPALSFYLIAPSSVMYDENYSAVDGSFEHLSDRNNTLATTNDSPDSHIQILLNTHTGNENFYLTGIYIKSPNASTYGFIQNWVLECNTASGNSRFYSQEFVNDAQLVGANNDIYIPINNVENIPCGQVFIRQTGENSIDTHHLCLGEIELYGVFK